jgi:hypothetical protein
VVLDIERQNAMPTLGIPRDSHLWSGMRGVSNLVSWWAAKVHIFSNEAPEACPDLEKGGHRRKKKAAARLKYCIVCGRLPFTTVNTYRRTYPTFCSTSLGRCLESNVGLSCQSRYISESAQPKQR